MPARFERYRMTDGRTPLGERYFNAIWRDIDLRIASLEEVKIAWSAAVDEVVKFGLVRIDELITEPLQAVVALSSQAESVSTNLEQLRLLAESRTAALAALIETLQADTAAQVNAFIAASNGDITAHKAATVANLTEWKNQRTAEIAAWMEDFEAAMQAARTEIDAQIDSLHRVRLERKAASFSPQPADTGKVFEVTATATVTLPNAAALGLGWCCTLRNTGPGLVTLQASAGGAVDGLGSYIMYPGESRAVQCDGVAITTEVERPLSLVMRESFDFHKPPGYRAFECELMGGTGGGGGGGSGGLASSSQTYGPSGGGGGGSGGAGGRIAAVFPAEVLPLIWPLVCGAAGTGGGGGAGKSSSTQLEGEDGGGGGAGGNTMATINGDTYTAAGGVGGAGGKKGSGAGYQGNGGNGGGSVVAALPNNAAQVFAARAHAGPGGINGGTSTPTGSNTAPPGAAGGARVKGPLWGWSGKGGDGSAAVIVPGTTSPGQAGAAGEPGKVIINGVL